MFYTDFLPIIFFHVGTVIEYVGLFFIVFFVATALVKLTFKIFTIKKVRATLAEKIMFALEIIIAGDILLATVATDLEDILRLGGIVLIRVVLGYALRKEMLK